ncbi:CLUMA_CG002449, isoform A [Clunio marinus]|uniref:CLUMA_CG002449, isoform A n=1 Tax=Clunio marinus TaxID=568069 RepID=A0A1J1HL09_9DIPT|nr:CLUMA_CG002449, isoform A [Clunio marinus]
MLKIIKKRQLFGMRVTKVDSQSHKRENLLEFSAADWFNSEGISDDVFVLLKGHTKLDGFEQILKILSAQIMKGERFMRQFQLMSK